MAQCENTHFCSLVSGYFLQWLFLWILSSLCFPNSLALILKFQHSPCCPGGLEHHLFPSLCQGHDDLVATHCVSSLPFSEPWILTGNPIQLPTFQTLPCYVLPVMLPNLDGSRKKAGGKPHHLTCFVGADVNRGTFRRVPGRERGTKQHRWQMRSCGKCEDPALRRALHAVYTS